MPSATLTPDGRHSAKDTAESLQLLAGGARIDPAWASMVVEVQVRDNRSQPDMAFVRFHDPLGDKLAGCPFKLGTAMVVKLGADTDPAPVKIFEGEVVALEPEWHEDGASIAVRAFDKGHRFNRTKRSESYLDKTATDIVKQAIGRAGVPAGTVQATTTVYKHFQQSMETDWDMCWRLARINGFEFGVSEGRAYFRKRKPAGAVATLTWQESLYKFHARASAVGQVSKVTVNSHDPKAKQATVGQSQPISPPAGAPDILNQRAKAIGDFGGGEALVADRIAVTTADAKTMADGALARNAAAFLEAEGTCFGSPLLTAGATVTIKGVGNFSGDYVLSATTHVMKGGGVYTTRFEITGDRPRTFSQLVGGGGNGGGGGGGGGGDDKASWSSQLVIAQVSNNNDPENMGRIKVKFDALGSNVESEWARVTTINAGKERGLFMLPQPGDSVVVGFEHGDPRRPFVLGSLYTGMEPLPAELKDGDGRKSKFGVKTDHQILAHSEKELKLHSSEKMTIEIKGNPGELKLEADGDTEHKGSKNVKVTAGQNFEVAANSSVKIKGNGTVEIESSGQLKVKGSTVSIEGSGMVEVKGAMIKLG
jgi:phage protein D/phage baseplate assembly protein gpV